MTDLGKFVVFKPVAGGYVYRAPAPLLLGARDHFLVTEGQKAAILATFTSSTRSVLWTIWISWLALSALLGTALSLWAYRSGHYAPGLGGVSAVIAIMLAIYPALVISRHVLLHRLRPILATLPPTSERITSLEEREAIRAVAKSAATISPLRRRIVRIASLVAVAATLLGMIDRAMDIYQPNQSKLLTLYLANATLLGLLNIVTIVAFGFLFIVIGRNSSRT
jgi:hypothetical protein